ncbi:MAG TPA: (d)CMP kinase [Candidatus Limnocylindrales bacterium]|nr:(d)CMP kinase [Candidatus Limnocylindrales bacterium]
MDAQPRGLVVALDGPASSGKSSVGAAAAVELGYRFCDTGLLYRAVTWLAMRRAVEAGDPEAVASLAAEIRLEPDAQGRLARVTVDDVDRTGEVHGEAVDMAVSAYARVPELRQALLERQRSIASDGRIIMAGRDVGTVVLPDADLKIYLDASAEERGRRRALERGIDPAGPAGQEILAELRRRDELDSTRPVAPLRRASDAIVLTTDGNTFEQTVAAVVATIQAKAAEAAASAPATATAPATEPEPPADRDSPARRRRAEMGAVRPGRAAPTPIISRKGLLIRFGSFVLRVIARLLARIHFEGDRQELPKGALIVAANHASSADPPILGAFLNARLDRPINWLGKRELLELPIVGWAMRQAAIHPVDRRAADVDAFRTAMRILESGNVLAVFPEGTRSRDGALQEVREGVAVLALRSGAPVLPVGFADTDRFWPRGKLLPHPGREVTVRFGKPFVVADELGLAAGDGADGASGRDRRQVKEAATRLIMTRIAELLPPRQRGVYAADVERAEAG